MRLTESEYHDTHFQTRYDYRDSPCIVTPLAVSTDHVVKTPA